MLTAPARHILCLLAIAVMPLGAAQSTSGGRITLAASEPESVIEARLSGDQTAWNLAPADLGWLTGAVQIGFLAGTLGIGLLVPWLPALDATIA